jgi:diguanylate cyclase (GGDEF)-like protein
MDTISPIRDDEGLIVQYVSTSVDYTALRQAQDKIEQLAFYDSLTDLPNRRLLHDRLKQAINISSKNYDYNAVLMLDIDKFKSINNSMGYKAGDELIKQFASILMQQTPEGGTVSRLGSDEFIIVLSVCQFRQSEKLIESVASKLKNTGVNAGLIELELTETMLIENVDSTVESLNALRALGVTLAIDDFGTGYSSLSYLKNFPIDMLKIDRSFIKDIGIDASDAAIIVAIITLANELNMSAIPLKGIFIVSLYLLMI